MKDVSDILGLKADLVPSGVDGPAACAPPIVVREPYARMNLTRTRRFNMSLVFGFTAFITAAVSGSVPVVHTPSLPPPPVISMYERAVSFQLDAPPEEAVGPNLRLWATHYHTPSVRAAYAEEAAFPLLGRDARPISASISHRDWCEAALQGSVSVRSEDGATAYVYVDSNGPEQVNCDEWLGSLSDGVKNATRRARFMKVSHHLGCGVRNHPLMPFRTIAVDPNVIPLESVVFVPELRGRSFTYEDRAFVHDGYLFAGDRGGAIKGRHIDVFLVEDGAEPLEDLFASHDGRTFAAHVVSEDDPRAIAIREAQSANCDTVTTG